MSNSIKIMMMAVLVTILPLSLSVAEENGDLNCDGSQLDISDLVYAVTYMFGGGPAPCTIGGLTLPWSGPTSLSYGGPALEVFNNSVSATGFMATVTGNYATGLICDATTGTYPWGVYGAADGTAEAVGVRGSATGTGINAGVYGSATPLTGVPILSDVSDYPTGVLGRSQMIGVVGLGGDDGFGVYGFGPVGVAGECSFGTEWAGFFAGKVYSTNGYFGVKSSIVIDDPTQPDARTISHSMVAAPTDIWIYDGKIALDRAGSATVSMPEYFPAIADEEGSRIQLTPVGRPFPVGAEWLAGTNSFIVYGEPGREVFWQVTADRNDPAAQQLRRPVVMDKTPDSRLCPTGQYLHPEVYGQPAMLQANRIPSGKRVVDREPDPRLQVGTSE